MTCFTFNILNYVNIILRGWLHSLIADHVQGCFSRSISLAALYGLIWERLEQQPAQRGRKLLLPCRGAPPKSIPETQSPFYSTLGLLTCTGRYLVPHCRAVPAQYMQDIIVPVQSGINKSGGFFSPFSKILQRGRNAPFLGRAEHALHFPVQGLQGCCREFVQFQCCYCILSFSSFFLWPLFASGWISLIASGIGNGNQVHKGS